MKVQELLKSLDFEEIFKLIQIFGYDMPERKDGYRKLCNKLLQQDILEESKFILVFKNKDKSFILLDKSEEEFRFFFVDIVDILSANIDENLHVNVSGLDVGACLLAQIYYVYPEN